MKKIKNISIVLFFVLTICYTFMLTGQLFTVQAGSLENGNSTAYLDISVNDELKKIQNIVQTDFENSSIQTCEYLYNLDDSADYIYVTLDSGGYVLYARNTMEMMEYSLKGELPYPESLSKKYYAGPSNYLQKSNDKFYDVLSGKQLQFSSSEIINFSNQIRNEVIFSEKQEKYAKYINEDNSILYENLSLSSSSPKYDEDKLIFLEHGTGNLIANYNYFLVDPSIGENVLGGVYGNGNSGTCGPVAAQLVLGYHNYYNDRRIVPDNMLNGYNSVSNYVMFPEFNPNFCTDPMSLTSLTAGTNSEDTGENSFYAKMIELIMPPNTYGSYINNVKNGINSYLGSRISSAGYTINIKSTYSSSVNSTNIKSEIDSGRPIIISMDEDLGGTNHFVVGYGYCDYTYPDNEGTYSGYIVHMGWKNLKRNCVWVNSSWCDGYISLKINHTHDYYTNGQIPSTGKMEYKCIECGHRTDAAINMLRNDKYMERQANITINSAPYKDYYVTFKTAGNKMFQTFGLENTKMELYDTEYQCLKSDDDSGYNLNAMFNYTVEANKPYILRVGFANSSTYGNIKIGITPASRAYLNYDYIMSSGGNNTLFDEITSTPNATTILTFKPSVSGTYTFRTGYQGTSQVDTYLYLIDPDGTVPYKFDDDSAGDLQAFITMNLIAYKPYFIIISPKTLSTASCELFLSINKLNT